MPKTSVARTSSNVFRHGKDRLSSALGGWLPSAADNCLGFVTTFLGGKVDELEAERCGSLKARAGCQRESVLQISCIKFHHLSSCWCIYNVKSRLFCRLRDHVQVQNKESGVLKHVALIATGNPITISGVWELSARFSHISICRRPRK